MLLIIKVDIQVVQGESLFLRGDTCLECLLNKWRVRCVCVCWAVYIIRKAQVNSSVFLELSKSQHSYLKHDLITPAAVHAKNVSGSGHSPHLWRTSCWLTLTSSTSFNSEVAGDLCLLLIKHCEQFIAFALHISTSVILPGFWRHLHDKWCYSGI